MQRKSQNTFYTQTTHDGKGVKLFYTTAQMQPT